MTAGGGNLEAALHSLLPFYISEVVFVVVQRAGELGTCVHHCLLNGAFAIEEVGHLLEAGGAIDLEVVDDGRLAGIFRRHNQAFIFLLAGFDGDGQHTLDGTQGAVQP